LVRYLAALTYYNSQINGTSNEVYEYYVIYSVMKRLKRLSIVQTIKLILIIAMSN